MKKSVIMAMTLFFAAAATTAGAQTTEEADKRPAVYFIEEITPENLVRIYEALGRKAEGRVAVKVSTGEPGGHNFLQPTLIADLVHKVGGTIVECNTAYGGGRSDTENHLKAAADHGFTSIADVDIMDADGEVALPVKGGRHLKEDFVGRNYLNYDFTVILSHFKGHAMGGFGGAIKNMSIGIASSKGKAWIHSAGKTKDQNKVWGDLPAQDDYSSPEDPKMGDIGILASLDPVALDKACVDMVRASKDHGKIHLIERIDSRHGMHTLDYGEKIGLGSQEYRLVRLDGK